MKEKMFSVREKFEQEIIVETCLDICGIERKQNHSNITLFFVYIVFVFRIVSEKTIFV